MGCYTSHAWVGEVQIDMSFQPNDCLRICNVKMKKKITGVKMGQISENVWVTGL